MSCDLTDTAILEAYQEIISGTPTNWLILGYHDTRDKISLYSKGTGGLDELKANLKEEVLYGFVRIEDRFALLAYVSEQVSGLRRARALVHGKAVAALFKGVHAQINASNVSELSEDKIRMRLGLMEAGPPTPDPSSSPTIPPNSNPRETPAMPVASPRPVTPISPTQQNPYANGGGRSTPPPQGPVPAPPSHPVPPIPMSDSQPSSPRRTGSPKLRSEGSASGLSSPRSERQQEIEAQERKMREEMERQKRSEALKRQRETQEREARERDLAQQKQTVELERRRKEESNRVQREAMKKQLMEMERLRGAGLSGYITIQSYGSPYWRRRFYVMRGQMVSFYNDEQDRAPISELKLGGRVTNIEDASLDCLIPNSFRVDLYTGETHLFFSDSLKDKELAIAGFMKCSEST